MKYTDRVQSTMSTDQKRKVSRVSSAPRCADSEICNRRNLKCACFSFIIIILMYKTLVVGSLLLSVLTLVVIPPSVIVSGTHW